jgi:hypothetical protein
LPEAPFSLVFTSLASFAFAKAKVARAKVKRSFKAKAREARGIK